MQKLAFTKMHGLGNDYIYVDCFSQHVTDPESLSKTLSDRHFGVGGDGVILVCPSDIADARMRMFNADGSEGMMCGNGIRCVAKFAYDKGLSRANPMRIETASGVKTLELSIEHERVTSARVDMGEPEMRAELIPVLTPDPKKVLIEEVNLEFVCLSMGNSHAVCFVEELTDELVLQKGPMVEKHRYFPKRINVEFAKVLSRTEIAMRVFERGSGETLACGTGACATAVAAALTGRTERNVTVKLLGGTLQIEWAENNHVYMSGPATTVFEGTINL